MGLDINIRFAKRKGFKTTKEKLDKLYKQLDKEYAKKNDEFDDSKARLIQKQIDEIYPWKDLAYFRKVNFLLPFFDYGENCSDLEISQCQIEDLISVCEEVLADNSKAEELLPTMPGFFFGSTEYNDYYFEEVEEVKNKFQEILRQFNPDKHILVMHCWW